MAYSMNEEDVARRMNIEDIDSSVTSLFRKLTSDFNLPRTECEAEKLKKEKRKLKKARQKEKKNKGKTTGEVKSEDDIAKKEEEEEQEETAKRANCHTGFRERQDEDTDSSSMSDNEDSDGADIDFSTVVPAFIQSIVNQKDIVKKQAKKSDSDKAKNTPKTVTHKSSDTMLTPHDTDDFTSVKKGTKHTPNLAFCKTPEGFGNEALRLIRENEFESAILCLNRGIALDRNDSRHYINRSYCYLRLGKFNQALADIKFASSHFTDLHEISRAKCREGQALFGLQEYEAAEQAFIESINLAPDFLFAKRELKRTQILRILDMGFTERDAILALEQKTTTMDAINLLSEESLSSTSYESHESSNEDDENDDEIFYSDTEEDPSNVRLLSKLLKYDPNMPEEPYVPEILPPYKEPIYNPISRTPSQDPPLRIFKAVAPVAKKPPQGINDMAVWVGSLTPQIKDEMITKRFSRFGKVIGVWRPPLNETYAFINFQCPTAAQKALEEAAFGGGTIEVNGFKLLVKPATNKTKTIK